MRTKTHKPKYDVRTSLWSSNIKRGVALSDKTATKLKKELDKLCSQYVRLRDDYTCVICGIRNPVWKHGDWTSAECGHLITRGKGVIRFDLRPDGNLHCQCHKCNVTHGGQHFRFKREIDQWPYIEWYIKKYGMDKWLRLRKESELKREWKAWELEELIEATTIALNQLKNEKGVS